MKLINDAWTTKLNGQSVNVEVWEAGRNGTMSPITTYYRYKGRWIAPIEQKRRGWANMTFNSLFQMIYGMHMRGLAKTNTSFISFLRKGY